MKGEKVTALIIFLTDSRLAARFETIKTNGRNFHERNV